MTWGCIYHEICDSPSTDDFPAVLQLLLPRAEIASMTVEGITSVCYAAQRDNVRFGVGTALIQEILDSDIVPEGKAPENRRLEDIKRLKLPIPPGNSSQRLSVIRNALSIENAVIVTAYPNHNSSILAIYEPLERRNSPRTEHLTLLRENLILGQTGVRGDGCTFRVIWPEVQF
jgi:hypothetical protein